MADALGFIETKGFVGAVAAADAMLKSADITLVGKEITGPALVLIKIKGDLASVKYAIEAGELAAKNAGNFISSLVMAEPDSKLAAMLPEINANFNLNSVEKNEEPFSSDIVEEGKPEIAEETKSEVIPVIKTGETGIHQEQKNEEMPDEITADNVNNTNDLPEEVKAIDESFNNEKGAEETEKIQQEILPEKIVKRKVNKTRTKIKKSAGADKTVKADEESHVTHVITTPIIEAENPEPDIAPEVTENELPVIDEVIISENITAVDEEEKIKKGKKNKQKPHEYHATLFDSLFDSLEDDPEEDEKPAPEPVINSTIERLKNEALGTDYEAEPVAPVIVEETIELAAEDAPLNEINENGENYEEAEPAPVQEEVAGKNSSITGEKIKKSNGKANTKKEDAGNGSAANPLSPDISMDYLSTLNVHLLRKAARGVNGFPIQGREISKANRQVLLDHFSNLL